MRDEPISFTFRHDMPFGAEMKPGGQTLFRLWAPAQRQVTLALTGPSPERLVSMTPGPDGMFTVTADEVAAGARYQFVLGGNDRVPDPASRFQPNGVHGPSEVIDPTSYQWTHTTWRGRPWEEAVIYEAHVGCFSPEGTFDGMRRKLDHLVDAGITALELMPIGEFEGRRNWGYDGVLPFAPDSAYGRPDDLKRLIDEAHGRDLMVILDVVYNHFGPAGNYLGLTAPQFVTDRYHTPWGGAVNFEDRQGYVRPFFIHNALYWLNEYRFDGLRFDAVHTIIDETRPDILHEIAAVIRREVSSDRHYYLILENDNNQSAYLDRRSPNHFNGQWNDDFHHAARVLTTGDTQAHFADYAASPVTALATSLARGFYYNGMPSAYRDGKVRGEDTSFLPSTAFIDFLQNHDQMGNRYDGKRISCLLDDEPLRALTAITLLSPAIPMLFMGEEWASEQPFFYFCDFCEELAAAVRAGRLKDFEHHNKVADGPAIPPPDPAAIDTFNRSKLDWDERRRPRQQAHLAFVRRLIKLRQSTIVPALRNAPPGSGDYRIAGDHALAVRWHLAENKVLSIAANLSNTPIDGLSWELIGEELITLPGGPASNPLRTMSPWDVRVFLGQKPGQMHG